MQNNRMKCLVILACCFVLAQGIAPEVLDQMKAHMIKLATECKAEVGAASEDIAPMMAHQPPTTPKGKCFVACINKKMGFQDATSGVLNKEGIAAWLDKLKTLDDDLYTKMKQVAGNCATEVVNDPDECETALSIFVCVKKEKAAVGLAEMNFNS